MSVDPFAFTPPFPFLESASASARARGTICVSSCARKGDEEGGGGAEKRKKGGGEEEEKWKKKREMEEANESQTSFALCHLQGGFAIYPHPTRRGSQPG